MKQFKFLLEVFSIISVVLVLGFAKVTFSNTLNTLAAKGREATTAVPGKETAEEDQSAIVCPGLINSKFIIVNY